MDMAIYNLSEASQSCRRPQMEIIITRISKMDLNNNISNIDIVLTLARFMKDTLFTNMIVMHDIVLYVCIEIVQPENYKYRKL